MGSGRAGDGAGPTAKQADGDKNGLLLAVCFGVPIILFFGISLFIMFTGTYFIGGLTLLYCKLVVGVSPRPVERLPNGERKRRVLLVTDTAQTQICGVLRKFNELQDHLTRQGHEVAVLHTDMFLSLAMPRYEEVRIAVPTPFMIYKSTRIFLEFDPDLVNLLTEGNCGLVARFLCQLTGKSYTTMWCTRYDLYLGDLLGDRIARLGRAFLTWFHSGEIVITPSPSMAKELIRMDCVPPAKCVPIMNGCNTAMFSPDGPTLAEMADMPRPIWLYVGRVSHEKNVLALLELHDKIEGSIAIVGKGPFFREAVERFAGPKVKFLGWRQGDELYAAYRSADAFAFTSRTDTFGQVNIEAMASGLPVAAFPVTGPIDLVKEGETGSVNDDLFTACKKAIATKDKQKCLDHARSFSWEVMSNKFMAAHKDI